MCSARCAEGRAIVTTDASSTIMSWAIAMIPRARKRLGSSTSAPVEGRVAGSVIALAIEKCSFVLE
jgi:hypothetical protein